ncbi:hypothetical protein [Marinobacterium stanieri]|nr:hypothetical protein [Marinobacterium stanieri]
MKRNLGIAALIGTIALSLGTEAQARLVIIQHDQAAIIKEQEREKAELEAKLEAEQLARIQEKEEEIKAVEEAKVRFDVNSYQVVADRTEKIINHFGVPPTQLPAHGGAGLGSSPLWISLNAIVPDGWRVYMDKSIDAQAKVAWNGHGKNWIAVLYEIGVKQRYVYDIDWNQHLVLVKPRVSVVDPLREEMTERAQEAKKTHIIIEADSADLPEEGDGVLVINGRAVKVRRARSLED